MWARSPCVRTILRNVVEPILFGPLVYAALHRVELPSGDARREIQVVVRLHSRVRKARVRVRYPLGQLLHEVHSLRNRLLVAAMTRSRIAVCQRTGAVGLPRYLIGQRALVNPCTT
jgi:hypothetical protein